MRLGFTPILASLILLNGCFTSEDDGNKAVLHEWVSSEFKSLDPALAYDTFSSRATAQIYEPLYQYHYLKEPYEIVPLLAADMPTYSKDRLTVTIRIRPGIRFQDDACFGETNGKGREVTAEDFIFSFKRLGLPSISSPGWWIWDGKIQGIDEWHAELLKTTDPTLRETLVAQPISGFKALDKHTLQIKLTRPYPQLLSVLAMPFTAVLPVEAIKRYADERGIINDEHQVGTGPFQVAEWSRSSKLILDQNPTYHDDFYPTEASKRLREENLLQDAGKRIPFLDRVVFHMINEDNPAWLRFLKGELDTLELPKDSLHQALAGERKLSEALVRKGIHLMVDPGMVFYYFEFNMLDSLVGKNKYLRQALASALDREKFVEIFTSGTGEKMTHAVPAGLAGRPAQTSLKFDYNLDRAKALLAKAGYPGGEGLPPLKIDMRGADSRSRHIGEYFQNQFSKIGVKTQILYNTFPAFLEKIRQANFQSAYGGWALDYPDADNVFQLLYGPNKAPGPNESNFNHPEMNRLYEQFAPLNNGAVRDSLVRRMDDLIQEEVPWAYIFVKNVYYLSHPWVKNFRGSGIIHNSIKYLRVDRDLKQRNKTN